MALQNFISKRLPVISAVWLNLVDWFFQNGSDSGAANAYVVSLGVFNSLAPFTLASGQMVRFIPANANTGASTVNVAGSGAKALVNSFGGALTGGEIVAAAPVWIQYNGTSWAIVNQVVSPDRARTAGEIATSLTPSNYSYASSPWYDTRRMGALTDNSTDNTTAVKNSIKACNGTTTQGGGVIFNPKNSKFSLTSLSATSGADLPARYILLYYGGDDTSDSSVVGTNELRWFVANANASGIVNEVRQESTFNPGHIINVRKNINIQDTYLGGGQSRTNPARATFALKDEDQDSFAVLYQQFPTQSGFSGTNLIGFRRIVTLNGITNTTFSGGAAAVDGTVTGNTSGAIGYVFSTDGSKTVVIWISGTFAVGEHVTWNAISSTATISSAPFSELQTVPLGVGPEGNGWALGLPTDLTTYPLTLGGPIGVQASRSASWYTPTTYADPFVEWVDSYENATPNGFKVYYNTTPAAANRRLTLRKYNASVDLAHVGAVKAYTQFGNAAIAGTSSFGVTSITRNGTGDYTITWAQTFARADYVVALTVDDPNDYPYVFLRTTTTLQVKVATNGAPGTPRNITGSLNVMVMGGDI